ERRDFEPSRFYPADPKLSRFAGVCARRRNPEALYGRDFVRESWCERRDSNPHGFTRQILSLVRLPIPPLSHLPFGQAVTLLRFSKTPHPVCCAECPLSACFAFLSFINQ